MGTQSAKGWIICVEYLLVLSVFSCIVTIPYMFLCNWVRQNVPFDYGPRTCVESNLHLKSGVVLYLYMFIG